MRTIQGDTWDTLSYRAYGSEFYTTELFKANPQHQHIFIFSENIEISVPDIDVAINQELPPWERVNITAIQNSDDMVNIINSYDPSTSGYISYRFIDRYTKRMIVATKKGF